MRLDGWTFALQAGNFLVLAWLLQRFLYKPVQAVLARRQQDAERARAEAAAAKEAAEALRRELEGQRAAISAERDRALEQAHAAAEADRSAILIRAQKEAEHQAAIARERLEEERREAAGALREQAARMAVELARRLLETSSPGGATLSLLDRACAALQAMPPAERASLAEGSGGPRRLQVVTASALAPEDAQRCRERLQGLLGGGVEVGFSTEPALLAGVELRFPHSVLRHSFRAGLDQALEELKRDGDAARNP